MIIKDIFERISPILLKANEDSINIGFSKRFFLFNIMSKIIQTIEDEPHLNFIAVLKNYNLLKDFLHGTLEELHRDRNKLYFKNFFYDRELYKLIKTDLEELYPDYKHLNLAITKRGIMIYNNYQKNSFNVLLMTIHAGTWAPENIQKKLSISPEKRFTEEDIDTDKLYRDLVLKNGGIWINNKQSRYVIDFNRSLNTAIYSKDSEPWAKEKIWDEELTGRELKETQKTYSDFYFTLTKLLDTHRFNIIFDGHSMKDKEDRPNMSFGIKYVPKFYLPIVQSMRTKLRQLGYESVKINKPYSGGFILKWLSTKFPDVFIFSMEINKCLYMTKNMKTTLKRKTKKIAANIAEILDIELTNFE